jgi:hypothetical protein
VAVRLDVVAVGVVEVGRVVRLVVVRAQARGAVVGSPRGERGLEEGVGGRAVAGAERDVGGAVTLSIIVLPSLA